jgi:pimeloyl-ACP methyl ester carboxylesterase
MWQRGPDRIRAGAPQPQDSTFTRWAGRDDNNMLDSYLLNLRMADYLRSRDDVGGIWLFGGSRSGPIALATGALDPTRVVAVNVHVPTSTGISWADPVYRGWGSRPDPAVAAYFDPVNFAPDLTVPLLVDGGIFDDLAYAPGILAMFNWAGKCPWKRLAIEPGGHGYFPKPSRPQMEDELGEYLKTHPATNP